MATRSLSSSLSSLDSLCSEISVAVSDSTSGSASTLSSDIQINSPSLEFILEALEAEQLLDEEMEAIENDSLFLQFLLSLMDPESDDGAEAESFYSSSTATNYSWSIPSARYSSSDSAGELSLENPNFLPAALTEDEIDRQVPLDLGIAPLSLLDHGARLQHYGFASSSESLQEVPTTGVSEIGDNSTKRQSIVFLRSGHITELEHIALFAPQTSISDMPRPTHTLESQSLTETTPPQPPAFADLDPSRYEYRPDSVTSSDSVSLLGSNMDNEYAYDDDAYLFSTNELSIMGDNSLTT
ncbi:hypothetical protein V1506DRAFT_528299 [Lipomyces tetrasporus]